MCDVPVTSCHTLDWHAECFSSSRMDILTSDTAIVVFSAAGLMATALSIVRDTRSQRQTATVHELSLPESQERVAA